MRGVFRVPQISKIHAVFPSNVSPEISSASHQPPPRSAGNQLPGTFRAMSENDDLELAAHSEAEHELISSLVEIEKIDSDLYRSKILVLPTNARGVFGGQVISHALLAATQSVPPEYAAHSLHSYFLLSASPAQPILYTVRTVREGRTYATRSVKASQNGKIVFMMLCSFQIPEPSKHAHQWPFPSDVPSPENSETSQQRFDRFSSIPGITRETKLMLQGYLRDRLKSPIEIRWLPRRTGAHGTLLSMYWMRARNIPKYEPHFQKSIFAYLSDLQLLSTVPQTLKLAYTKPPPFRIGMLSTIDHSIWFYDHDFDCSDWILYVMESPSSGMGRGLVHGRSYTQDGRLIANVVQEGVVRPAEEGVSHSRAIPVPGRAKL